MFLLQIIEIYCSYGYKLLMVVLLLCIQVSDILSTAESLLGDLNGHITFYREAVELKDELYDYQKEQFDG